MSGPVSIDRLRGHADAMRLVLAAVDGDEDMFYDVLREASECSGCLQSVCVELVKLLAHHINDGGDRQGWIGWLTTRIADSLDALAEIERAAGNED